MDERTLTALKGSIEKWKAIEAGNAADHGWTDCPLCQMFIGDDCVGCPVRERNIEYDGCGNPAHRAWGRQMVELHRLPHNGERKANTPALVALAREEREFLESLLPEQP